MRRVWLAIIVVIIVVVGLVVLFTHKSSSPGTSSSSMSNMNMSSSSSSSSSKLVATDKVTIANFAFSPSSITVKKGTTVTWTNQDSVAHTVTEVDGKTGPQSSDVEQGKSFSFTYNTTGTFKYHCSIHPNMTGSVTVTD